MTAMTIMTGFFINCVRRLGGGKEQGGLTVVSKNITAGKNVIAVTGSLMAGHPAERRGAGGFFRGRFGLGSGEARSVSDTKFQKSMSCHMGLSGKR